MGCFKTPSASGQSPALSPQVARYRIEMSLIRLDEKQLREAPGLLDAMFPDDT
jgi:hypothetical protein